MLFTIITVVMDEYDELVETFNSIVIQKYSNIEWLVIHGGADVRIPNFLVKSKDLIKIKFISEPDKGIYDAMNKGKAMASGNYIVFLNAGDTLYNKLVISEVYAMVSKNNIYPDIVFGAAKLVFDNGFNLVRYPRDMDTCIWHGLPANHQATYYKNTSIIDPPYDLKYKMCGDYYIVSQFFLNNSNAILMNRILVNFKIGGASYQHPWTLIKEAYSIQRDVLRVSFIKRLVSMIRRTIARLTTIALENNIFLGKIIRKYLFR